ncbi:unnamed protein product [Rotaria socialis]|uniref:MULE transposase domain-containing protein n=1 Tax=Rotaria socialis TaxID=392032 RepID=A0A819B205_9BILA|nr:unnamed protein product [Rotaria socialis]
MTQKEENFPESIQLARNDQENIGALNLLISTSTQPPNNLFNYYKQRAEILFYLNKYEDALSDIYAMEKINEIASSIQLIKWESLIQIQCAKVRQEIKQSLVIQDDLSHIELLARIHPNNMKKIFNGTCRKQPQFDHKLWNFHDRVVATVPRSNNSVEGWHNAVANRAAISHLTIVKLEEKNRREQAKFEVDMAKILQGHDIKTKKACYRKMDERITLLVNSFSSTQLDQFLKNIAANVTL